MTKANPRAYSTGMPEISNHTKKQEIQEAEKAGIDISQLEHNLSLSIDERLEQHQRALDMIEELLRAKADLEGHR